MTVVVRSSRPRALTARAGGSAFAALAALVLAALAPGSAAANPNEGEGRSLLRDADRPYTVVVGEADASATVQNPANLGHLEAIGGVLDAAFTAPAAGRRGSGAGAFVGIPLPLQIAALGVGYQWLWPVQRSASEATGEVDQLLFAADNPYGKFTLALAVPLMRWISGLSVGVNYSRIFSARNPWAAGVNQVDLGASYRVNRFFGAGLVARGLNQPRITSASVGFGPGDVEIRMPVVLDPELVLRPLGRDTLELGIGARLDTRRPESARFVPSRFNAQPRARLLVSVRGVRLFTEGEIYTRHDDLVGGDPRVAARLTAGVELGLAHVGIAAGALAGAGGGAQALEGGVGRIRLSRARHATAFPVAPRRVTRYPLSKVRGDRGTWRLVQEIDELARRRGSVLLLETRGLSLSFAQIEELREALRRFQADGGKVVAYLEGGDLKTYFLVSGADRLIVHPERELAMVGMQLRTLYFGEILGRLGAKAEFVRIAEYKGAAEIYAREGSSEPVRQQRRQLLADVWNHVLRLVARDRGVDPLVVDGWIDAAPHRPAEARRLGIVDEIAWPDELDARLEAWLSRKVRIEQAPRTPAHDPDLGPRPEVAVLFIEGDLATGPSLTIPLLGRRVAGSETLVAAIDGLRKDRNVRAVVVRINSGGGSVAAAENITRALDRLAAEKPVVISMSTAAGSGAYYIATAGDYIVADATTITGSIGIFYPKVDLSGVLEKFGVGVEIEQLGDMATLRSWFKPYSEAELEAAMRSIEGSYATFVERVAEARNLRPEEVDALARGRVFAGARAIEVGLVDRHGGLRDAVGRARRMAAMRPDELAVGQYPAPPSLLSRLRTLFGLRIDLPLGATAEALEGATRSGPGRLALGAPGAGAGALLPAPLRAALSELPAAMWLSPGPEALAMPLDTLTIE